MCDVTAHVQDARAFHSNDPCADTKHCSCIAGRALVAGAAQHCVVTSQYIEHICVYNAYVSV
jgi:hypothetical protein